MQLWSDAVHEVVFEDALSRDVAILDPALSFKPPTYPSCWRNSTKVSPDLHNGEPLRQLYERVKLYILSLRPLRQHLHHARRSVPTMHPQFQSCPRWRRLLDPLKTRHSPQYLLTPFFHFSFSCFSYCTPAAKLHLSTSCTNRLSSSSSLLYSPVELFSSVDAVSLITSNTRPSPQNVPTLLLDFLQHGPEEGGLILHPLQQQLHLSTSCTTEYESSSSSIRMLPEHPCVPWESPIPTALASLINLHVMVSSCLPSTRPDWA